MADGEAQQQDRQEQQHCDADRGGLGAAGALWVGQQAASPSVPGLSEDGLLLVEVG